MSEDMNPIIADVKPQESAPVIETVDLPLADEIAALPFFVDGYLKVDKEGLKVMQAKGWDWLTTDRMIDYRANWTTWFGLREFVQNALDETGSVEIDYDAAKNITYVKDNGKGFLTKHLLLGKHKGLTSKEVHLSRGCFGEGMKLAALPFFRNGSTVFIRTVGLDIAFAMGPFDEHYVHYTFKRKNNHQVGTHIAISNFNGSEHKSKFTCFIPPEKLLLTAKRDSETDFDKDKVRQVFDLPGDIFVRDIFVMNRGKRYDAAYFGYNFWFTDTRDVMDPDRTSIRDATGALRFEFDYILGCEDVDFLEKFFRKISQPCEELGIEDPRWSFEHHVIRGEYLTLNKARAEAVHKAIKRVFGNGEYTWSSNYEEEKALEHLGVLDLTNKLPDLSRILHAHKLIKTAQEWIILRDLKHTCSITEKMVSENFGDQAQAAFKRVLDVLTDIAKTFTSTKSQVEFFWSIKPSTEVDRVGGFYTHMERKISVKVTQLNSFHRVMETFIHELGHALSHGAKDLSEDFERGLVEAGFAVTDYFAKVNPESFGKLKDDIHFLTQFDWKKLKFDLADTTSTISVDNH